MPAVYDGLGAALSQKASEILSLDGISGPVALVAKNEGTVDAVLSVVRKSDSTRVNLSEDTAVSGEDTAYDGDASTLAFSGQSLNNTPIVPGSVTVKPTAGGNSVNLTDKDADGKLYTDDNDLDLAGSINYFTGALVLNFPSGKDPASTNITADYTHQTKALKPEGIRTFKLGNVLPNDTYSVKAAGNASAALVRITGVTSRP